MIFDKIENLGLHFNKEESELMLKFINSVDVNTENGKHEIDGDKIFAFVSNYKTKTREEAVLEGHKKYADIHILKKGAEAQEFYFIDDCEVTTPYSEDCEAALFNKDKKNINKLVLVPNYFSYYADYDIHMPQLAVNSSEEVKKIVIKYRLK